MFINLRNFYYRLFVSFCVFCFVQSMQAEDLPNDSINSHRLNEVEVRAQKKLSNNTTSPNQVLNASELAKINALQVSDVVKYFSGVQVKDYGGVGGLKTVSVRSLGAGYTGVLYDGFSVSNYQTGQVDLGRFSIDNVDVISLNIGGFDDIFQTARTQASVGVLSIKTQKNITESEKLTYINAGLKYGSWNYINPSVLYAQRLNSTFSTQVSGVYIKSSGDYPFVSESGEHLNRDNSDVESLKLEANLFGKFKNGGSLSFKVYGYDSERGLPGPDIFYNHNNGTERAWDKNIFSQVQYIQSLSSKFDIQTNAKFDFSKINYEKINNLEGRKENIYYQREYYLNLTLLYKINPDLSFSWANDGSYSNFENNFNDCVFPSRKIWQTALSGKYKKSGIVVTGSFLGTFVDDDVKVGEDRNADFRLSPYLGISYLPFTNTPLYIRGFYKNTYRLPTFSDLYFSPSTISSSNLQPENANQYNLGISWSNRFSYILPFFSVSVDGYLNHIENKIIAIPKSSMFIWSVQNLGKVETKGIDTRLQFHVQTGEKFLWQVSGNYTYQNVLNKTNPEDKKTYNQQISYTPRHSGSGVLSLQMPWFNFNYSMLYAGSRYFMSTNRPEYKMKAYEEQNVSLSKSLIYNKMKFDLQFECNNIFNEQYEVVRSYPMPGRSFLLGLKFTY